MLDQVHTLEVTFWWNPPQLEVVQGTKHQSWPESRPEDNAEGTNKVVTKDKQGYTWVGIPENASYSPF